VLAEEEEEEEEAAEAAEAWSGANCASKSALKPTGSEPFAPLAAAPPLGGGLRGGSDCAGAPVAIVYPILNYTSDDHEIEQCKQC
jgi:hypothetical protein